MDTTGERVVGAPKTVVMHRRELSALCAWSMQGREASLSEKYVPMLCVSSGEASYEHCTAITTTQGRGLYCGHHLAEAPYPLTPSLYTV